MAAMLNWHHRSVFDPPQSRPAVLRLARLCLLLVLLARPVLALDPVKAAENMARQAAGAFEKGEHLRAAQLYLQAFASDGRIPDYIYGAARAEQAAGKFDVAERHFEQYLQTAPQGSRANNARKYLAEVRVAIADQKAADGTQAESEKNWPLAAQIWRTCHELAPRNWEFAFREAVNLAKAGQKTDAIGAFAAYLRDAPKDARDRGEAKTRLEALMPGATQEQVAQVVHAPVPVKPETSPPPLAGTPPAATKESPTVVATPIAARHTDRDDNRSTERAVAWTVTATGPPSG